MQVLPSLLSCFFLLICNISKNIGSEVDNPTESDSLASSTTQDIKDTKAPCLQALRRTASGPCDYWSAPHQLNITLLYKIFSEGVLDESQRYLDNVDKNLHAHGNLSWLYSAFFCDFERRKRFTQAYQSEVNENGIPLIIHACKNEPTPFAYENSDQHLPWRDFRIIPLQKVDASTATPSIIVHWLDKIIYQRTYTPDPAQAKEQVHWKVTIANNSESSYSLPEFDIAFNTTSDFLLGFRNGAAIAFSENGSKLFIFNINASKGYSLVFGPIIEYIYTPSSEFFSGFLCGFELFKMAKPKKQLSIVR